MEEQLISFKIAKLAKEKGFKLPYPTACYTEEAELYISENLLSERITGKPKPKNIYIAPTQSLLQKWLREKHNIDIIIEPNQDSDGNKYYCWRGRKNMSSSTIGNVADHYEEALEKGLIEALKLIKL